MATLTIDQNPSVTDTIVFTLLTPDASGCFLIDPYKVNKAVIYFIERDFVSGNVSEYDNLIYDTVKLQIADNAEAIACSNPTPENITTAKNLRYDADSSATTNPFYFSQANPVKIIGNDDYPAWASYDPNNSILDHIVTDANNNTVYGQFEYTWHPEGMREGDYFICWTWTPNIAGSTLSSHIKFYLKGDTTITTTLPTHSTNPEKYTTLLDRYTPEMFKLYVSADDRTPDVLDKFNKAIASSFTDIENMANQILDLQDANILQESLLPYLSNLFDLKLKTTDPTRWRGQIKRAIPLFKMKGTKKALMEALDQASMKMLSLNQLWEIISSYTWQEAFTYDGLNSSFALEKIALPIDYVNFELYFRAYNSNDWISLSLDYIDIQLVDGISVMTWVGSNLSVDPLDLVIGDEIRIIYLYNAIPNPSAQTLENYIRSLPLMDLRDERDQIFPLKNWNVRVIAENDAMFNLVVPDRHPFHENIVYGKIRTEFPYSENIYNMDEYNGSIRNSKVPCDIDRDFISPCKACLGGSYNIDIEIENLSNDRIEEAKEVLIEYTPFHAVLHTMNFIGSMNEFVEPPLEEIEALIEFNSSEFCISGDAQTYFNRIMTHVETEGILRNQLANVSIVVPTTSGTGYNDNIVMFCPDVKLDYAGIILDGTAEINILSPSPLAGIYLANNPNGNVIEISSASEPIANCNNLFAIDGTINTCAFTFDINNPVLDGTLCNIEQDNLYTLKDLSEDFGLLMTKSTFDVIHGTAATAWSVLIPAYSMIPYVIEDIRPDGSLVLTDNGSLPNINVTGVSYQLINGVTTVISSTTGDLSNVKRGKITALSPTVQPIASILDGDNFYHYVGSSEYPVIGFVPSTTDQYYIGNYNGGDINGANLKVKRKVISNEIGYLSYRGLKLEMAGDYETSLGIQNGANSLVVVDDGVENDGFKENFIVIVDTDSYFISEINGNSPPGSTTFTLSGVNHYWKTTGTAVNVTIYKYTKNGATIMGQQDDLPPHTFLTLDRNGRPVITGTYQDGTVEYLSVPNGNEIKDIVNQTENISFKIEYSDGMIEKGEI